MISYTFQECPQLAVERADAGVSNPRDLWDMPAVALRSTGAIGLIPRLLGRLRGNPHLGRRELILGRMCWLLRHSKRVQEGLSNNNNLSLMLSSFVSHIRPIIIFCSSVRSMGYLSYVRLLKFIQRRVSTSC